MPFAKGQSGNPAGRKPGLPNRNTAALKDAILLAGANAGDKLTPGSGLVGYLEFLASEEPPAFASLLGKVLPMQVSGEGGGPVLIVTGVPRDGRD